MELVDTHCHIHEAAFAEIGDDQTHTLWAKAADPDPDAMIERARQKGVTRLICVGVTLDDSQHAVEFVQNRQNCWAAIGIHPHEANSGRAALEGLAGLLTVDKSHDLVVGDAEERRPVTRSQSEHVRNGGLSGRTHDILPTNTAGLASPGKIVAIGECGLDYFYHHSTKKEQEAALRFQIELALHHNLPMIFHVREAFDDFWPIFDSYQGVRGVLHSFTDNYANFERAMQRGLYVGVNGIMTFTKNADQLQIAKEVPLQKLLIETDAPFLTPAPLRGTVNEPAHVSLVTMFLAELRKQSAEDIAIQTTKNARHLFALS